MFPNEKEKNMINLRMYSIDEIKARNEKNGGHWFSKGALRFFNGRVSSSVFQGRKGQAFFVSSERYSYLTQRQYTVRVAQLDGSISTVEFLRFPTLHRAKSAAKSYAKHLIVS